MFYDLIILKRVLGTSTFDDLVSKYDLVVHSIASLSLQRSNIPKESIVCTFDTLQNMDHSVRTDSGESSSTYGGDKWAIPLNNFPQGLGKGNRAAPEL